MESYNDKQSEEQRDSNSSGQDSSRNTEDKPEPGSSNGTEYSIDAVPAEQHPLNDIEVSKDIFRTPPAEQLSSKDIEDLKEKIPVKHVSLKDTEDQVHTIPTEASFDDTEDSSSYRIPPSTTNGPGEATLLLAEFFDSASLNQATAEEKSLRVYSKITKPSFYVFMGASAASATTYLVIWLYVEESRQFVNMFTAFMGLAVAMVLNIFASYFGIVSIAGKYATETDLLSQCNAIRWLLIAGMFFNIVCPSCALRPLESDYFSKASTLSLRYCSSLDPLSPVSESCKNAKFLKISVCTMYCMLLLEIYMLVIYSIWILKAQARLLVLKESEMLQILGYESNSRLALAIRRYSEQTTITAID